MLMRVLEHTSKFYLTRAYTGTFTFTNRDTNITLYIDNDSDFELDYNNTLSAYMQIGYVPLDSMLALLFEEYVNNTIVVQ
jgi:hypothetical protein